MSIAEIGRLADAVRFRIYVPSFSSWYLTWYRNFLHRGVNPQFVNSALSGATRADVFDINMNQAERTQLRELQGQRNSSTRLKTLNILYLERQRQSFNRLVQYWTREVRVSSQGGENASAFAQRQEWQQFVYVCWKSPGPYRLEVTIPPVLRACTHFNRRPC